MLDIDPSAPRSLALGASFSLTIHLMGSAIAQAYYLLYALGLEWQSQRLRWHDWTRYSSRQKALMQLGGLIGEIDLEGPALSAFWPALWLGQWTHVGKGTAFGLGGYRIVARADLADVPSQACNP